MSGVSSASGQAVISSVRTELKNVFEAAKRSYAEAGNLSGVAQNYVSADGEVTISLTGGRTSDGKEYLSLSYKVDGKSGDAVGRILTGGIDMSTGLRYSADTQYGGPQMNAASDTVDSVDDIAAFEKSIADSSFKTQDEENAQITSWATGNRTFTSLKDFQAYNRVEEAARKQADTIMKELKFDSPHKENEFYKSLIKGLSAKAHYGDDSALKELMKDVPSEVLEKSVKGLSRQAGTERLIDTLQGMLSERDQAGKNDGRRVIDLLA